MHECPNCGQACDCDGEDLWQPPPDDCCCPCVYEEEDWEDDYDPDEAIGSCRNCGTNLYADDDIGGGGLCDQCEWWEDQCEEED